MPIETTNYMILGFAVAFVTIGLHLFSFPLRTRNLKADLQLLQAKPKTAAKKPAAKKTVAKKAAKKTAKKTAKKAARKTARR